MLRDHADRVAGRGGWSRGHANGWIDPVRRDWSSSHNGRLSSPVNCARAERDPPAARLSPPLDLAGLLAELGERAVPGIEEFADGAYRRSLRLPHGPGIATVHPGPAADGVLCDLRLTDLRDLATAVNRIRRLLDLDADATAIADRLGSDPLLGPPVHERPGLRIPGSTDPAETALRVALGEVGPPDDAVRTLIGDVVKRYGTPLDAPVGTVTHTFPDAQAMLRADSAMARALTERSVHLDPGASWDQARRELEAVGVVTPEGIDRILVHGLGDPDAPLLHAAAERWRPWRSYAARYLATIASTSP